MTSDPARRDAARLALARIVMDRFPPGPERDAWFDWLARVESDREIPLPAGSAPEIPIARRTPAKS